MKQQLIAIIFLLICGKTQAQEWAPIGAKWYYEFSEWGWPGTVRPVIVESIGDTLLNNKNCKIISVSMDETGYSYMYSENGIVYMYNDSTKRFHILYNFLANVGDSWTIVPPIPSDSFNIVVDSISKIYINNDSLKVLHVTTAYQSIWSFSDRIIENIGDYCFLVPQYSMVDPWICPIRCYDDPVKGLYKFSTTPCDTSFNWQGVYINDKSFNGINFNVFPNPIYNNINIRLLNNNLTNNINIISPIGIILQTIDIRKENSIRIDMSKYANGIYFIKIIDEQGNTGIKKIIKK